MGGHSGGRKIAQVVTYQGRTQSLYQWAAELGLSHATLHGRIVVRGWPVEKAFTTPSSTKVGHAARHRNSRRRENVAVTPENGYPKKITCMGSGCKKQIISTWAGDRFCPACRAYANNYDW